MRYQVTEQENGKFSLYTDTGHETSMADEELLFWDLSEERAGMGMSTRRRIRESAIRMESLAEDASPVSRLHGRSATDYANMGAKRSAEMKFALALYKGGWNAHAAAKEAGVLPSSFYRLLKEERVRPAGTLGVHVRSPKG